MKHARTLATFAAGLMITGSSAALATSAHAARNLGGAPLPPGTTAINLLHFNDFHGRIDTDGKGTLGKNFACTLVTQREQLGAANTLTVSAGDLIGASPFTSSIQNDEPTLDFMNTLGLQTSAAGNHEFDKGLADLTDRVEPRTDFDYLAANVVRKDTGAPAMKTHETFDVAGVKVAVVGAVTADTANLVSGEGVADVQFTDPVAAVNTVTDQLTDGNAANGEADVIVANYHEGGPYSSTTGTYEDQLRVPIFAKMVSETSAKVDAILNAHTHQTYVYDAPVPGVAGETRPVVQTGQYAANLGQIQLGYDPAKGEVTAYNAALVPSTAVSPGCESNATYQAAAQIVDRAIAYAAPIAAQPVGKVTADISRGLNNGAEDRGRESALANLVAQQYVDVVNAPGRIGGADIGVMNPGGVRADLPYGTDGTVTFAQAAAVLPFGNTVKTADYTGAQVKALLEEQWQPAGASRPFLALGLSKNVTYTYDPARAQGDRVTAVFVNGAPIDPAATYTIASASFLITNAGVAPDNFATFLAGTNYRDSGLVDQNAFVEWFKANSPVAPPQVQHGVAAIGAPITAAYGDTVKLRVEGLDLASKGAVAGTRVVASIDGRTVGEAAVMPGRIGAPSPTRDGAAEVSVRVIGRVLPPHRRQTAYIKVVAEPTGTTVWIPLKVTPRTSR